MMIALQILTLILLLILAYAWLGYPLILALVTRSRLRRSSAEYTNERTLDSTAPTCRVAILVAAHNEELHIGPRLENLLRAGPRAFDIYVGLDGCTDRTGEIARDYASRHANIHVHEFTERRGKVAVLKDLVKLSEAGGCREPPRINGLLVFTDANTEFRPEALEKLLRHFGDPKVGGVCGRLVFTHNSETSPRLRSGQARLHQVTTSEGLYWRWETWLKERESALDSCLGANGAIFALHRDLFWREVPDNTVVDDFVIGMKVRERGFRMIYDPEAAAEEELPAVSSEWRRRVRIGAGDFQALQFCRTCLLPKYGRFAWMFWSHKVLRWFTPHAMLLVLVLAAWHWMGCRVSSVPPSRFALWRASECWMSGLIIAISLLGSACGVLGRVLSRFKLANSVFARPLLFADHFVTMQAAIFVGFLAFCRGNLSGHWTRTPRKP